MPAEFRHGPAGRLRARRLGSWKPQDLVAFLFACLIGGALVAAHHRAQFDSHIVWDGFTLPGFDAHVYVAMAEEPRVFTVGPWGYRILAPQLLNAFLPPRLIVPGFDGLARTALVMASGLLFVYLRILGVTVRAALLAVLVMMLTPSVGTVFENRFLVEPFALVLLLIALIAIQSTSSVWAIALALVLLSLVKEIWVALLPLFFLKDLPYGVRAASVRTLQVAAPATWVAVLTRWMWAPQKGAGGPAADSFAALSVIESNFPLFAPEFLLGGFSVAALLALHRREARGYLEQHILTLLPLLALPVLAAVYTGEGASTSFFTSDVRRLLIYVLPFAAGLAVHLDPGNGAPRPVPREPRREPVTMVFVAAFMLAPLTLDRYSRIDLSTSRDGPYVLGYVRETLKTARKLDRGETVVFDPVERKFAWGVSPPGDLSKLRFFLRSGFGPQAHYGIHDIRMRETEATIIAPILDPRTLNMALTIDARESTWISILAGGNRVGEALVGPQAVRVTFVVPPESLFRGDNPIGLFCDKAASALPRILRIELSQPRP